MDCLRIGSLHKLQAVDQLQIQVLVDNVTDNLSSVPAGVTHEIPRVIEYEKGFLEHVRQNGAGEWEPDPLILDERFLTVHVRNKGLIVFSACSHAGIVNVLKHAQEQFPEVPLHAVMVAFIFPAPR